MMRVIWLDSAMQNMARVVGGFLDRRGRKVGDWCVMVAATRGDSLSIAVQPWLKGNLPHISKKKKGNWGEVFGSLHREERKLERAEIARAAKSKKKGEQKRKREGRIVWVTKRLIGRTVRGKHFVCILECESGSFAYLNVNLAQLHRAWEWT